MLPLTTRRRARRRTLSRRVVVFGTAIVLTIVIIGGLTQVSRNSGTYNAGTSRSFASQVSVVATASNVTASSLRQLMSSMSTQDRQMLQSQLDSLVQQSAQQESQAATLSTPAPSSAVAQQFATVFSDRARAVSTVRSALDGLLGMHPVPVAGAVASDASVATPTLLSSSEATNRIVAAGALLARSDRNYVALRHTLARSAGHARVPSSTWVTDDGVWQTGTVAAQIAAVGASPSLTANTVLILSAVQLSPPALPAPTGAATSATSTLTPTHSLTVSPVLTNQGSVDVPRGTVHIKLITLPSGRSAEVTRTAAVAASRSVALDAASFAVKPGVTYQLNVAIALPSAQTATGQTDLTYLLQIAPGAPTTTTAG